MIGLTIGCVKLSNHISRNIPLEIGNPKDKQHAVKAGPWPSLDKCEFHKNFKLPTRAMMNPDYCEDVSPKQSALSPHVIIIMAHLNSFIHTFNNG